MIINANQIGADNVLRMRFTTHTYNTDPRYQARTSFYFGIVQDIAAMHAACRRLSIPEMRKQGMTWVILRSRMHIDRYTAWPEDIIAETWAEEPRGLHMPRIVRAFDEECKPLFEARTDWAVLDIARHFRPVRPEAITAQLKIPALSDRERRGGEEGEKRVSYDDSGCRTIATCTPSIHLLDTDANHHVNNISYLHWVLDSLPNDFRDRYKVEDIDVSWLKQTFLGDKITVMSGSASEDPLSGEHPLLHHKIVRGEEDGTETILWEGMSRWAKREKLTDSFRLSP